MTYDVGSVAAIVAESIVSWADNEEGYEMSSGVVKEYPGRAQFYVTVDDQQFLVTVQDAPSAG